MKQIIFTLFGLGIWSLGLGSLSLAQVGIGTTTPTGMVHIDPISAAAIIIDDYGAGAGQTGELQFRELAANGTNYAGFKAPDNISSNLVWVLPAASGSNGQILITNGNETLSWANGPGGGWQLLGKTTLTAAATTMTVTFTPKTYLYIIAYTIANGTSNIECRTNADATANYSRRVQNNGGADATAINNNESPWGVESVRDQDKYIYSYVVNKDGQEKLFLSEFIHGGGTGAGNAPFRSESAGKWDITAGQINQVDIFIGVGAGNYAAGSSVVVLGRD